MKFIKNNTNVPLYDFFFFVKLNTKKKLITTTEFHIIHALKREKLIKIKN